MQNFTEDQIKRQDFVDNEIYDLVKRLIPSEKEIGWDIGRNVPRKPHFVGGVKQGTQCRRKYLSGKRCRVGGKLQMIGDIRDTIQHWLVDRYRIVDELEFYP